MRKNQVVVSSEKWEGVWGNLYYGTPHNYPINKEALEKLAALEVEALEDEALICAALEIIWNYSTGSRWPHMAQDVDVNRHELGVILVGSGWTLHYEKPGLRDRIAKAIAASKEAA